MRIDTEAFLTITALLAATAAPACSSDTGTGTSPDGGSGGSGASSTGGKPAGGAGGSGAATGGSSGSGGTAGGAGGSGGKAQGGADAGPETGADATPAPEGDGGSCLGDTAPPAPDSGGTDVCDTLPSALDGCHPDAGVEGLAPAYAVCSDLEYAARPGVFADVAKCLATGAPANPCGAEATAHAVACYDGAAARACRRGPVDGGLVDPCTAFVAACKTVTAAECGGAFSAFSEEGAGSFSDCLSLATPVGDAGVEGSGDCRTAFWSCVLPGVTR